MYGNGSLISHICCFHIKMFLEFRRLVRDFSKFTLLLHEIKLQKEHSRWCKELPEFSQIRVVSFKKCMNFVFFKVSLFTLDVLRFLFAHFFFFPASSYRIEKVFSSFRVWNLHSRKKSPQLSTFATLLSRILYGKENSRKWTQQPFEWFGLILSAVFAP